MHARVSTYRIPADRTEEGVRQFEQAVEALRGMEGVREALLLVDAAAAKALTITLWESEEAMRASEEAADRVRTQASGAAGGTVETVERYEVAFREQL